jgi:phosphohistidine swiveling domain-containing protein
MASFVLPLSSAGRGVLPRIGSKAAHLGELLRAGFPVPDGFCVTCEAYRVHVSTNGLSERIQARLSREDINGAEAVKRASAEIRSWIVGTPPPPDVVREVQAALAGMGEGVAVAVRSSAIAEDLPGASFAGQHDTSLDVVGPGAALERLRECWASLWTERAILYAVHNGIDLSHAAMACVVQVMVPAELAGVAFTADPVSGERDRIMINMVTGLGEALVSGRVNASQYLLRKSDGTVLDRRLSGEGERIGTAFLPPLWTLACRVEDHFGLPQDIEWAIAGGRPFLLQARPITRLVAAPVALREAERPLLYYSERVREMIPSALTPLTGDVFLQVILPTMNESLAHHGLIPRALAARTLLGARLLRGRIFMDVSLLRSAFFPGLDELRLIDLLESGKRPPLHAFRLSALLLIAPRIPFVLPKLVRWMSRLDRLTRESEEGLNRLLVPLEHEDLRLWDRPRLRSLLRMEVSESFRRDLIALPPANALARGLGTAFYTALVFMAVRWGGEPKESGGALVSGLGGLNEVECAAALWELAEQARGLPAVMAALEGDLGGARAAIAGIPEAASWRAAFAAFLLRFGHRGIEEVELARPRWRERPEYPLSVIANYVQCGPNAAPRAVEARRRGERELVEARVLRRLRLRPLRRFLFSTTLDIARKASVAGENTKFHIVRLLMLQRGAALEIGRRLLDEGRLAAAEDVFFLTLDELDHGTGGDLKGRVASRRADYERWQREDPPRLIDGKGRPVQEARAPTAGVHDGVFWGIGSSPGLAKGRVRLVRDPTDGARLDPGAILVAPYTDPAWTPLFLSAGAVVVETGSLLSHASIVARELGIPSVVALSGATRHFTEGEEVEVDGTHGSVRRMAASL